MTYPSPYSLPTANPPTLIQRARALLRRVVSPVSSTGVRDLLRNVHFWTITLIMAVFTSAYYGSYWGLHDLLPAGGSYFAPEFPHDLHRAFYLLPMLYAAAKFRLRGAIAVSLLTPAILLPYSFLVSPFPDATTRAFVFGVGASLATVLLGLAQERGLRLKNDREFISALIDTAGALIFLTDVEGRIILFNRACENSTGFSHTEVTGRKFWEVFVIHEDVKPTRQVFDRILAGHYPREHQNSWVSRNGDHRLITWSSTGLCDENGVVQYVLSTGIDVTQQQRAEQNIRRYAELVTEAQEEERKRIARELHDETAQELARLALDIDLLIGSPKGLPSGTELTRQLESFRKRTDHILQGVRRHSQDLRPPILEDFGLLVALQWITEILTNHYMLNASVEVVGTPRRMAPNTELVLFRIAQEALINVRRHAHAKNAVVRLAFSPDSVTVSVSDDGTGFEKPVDAGDFVRLGKLGLLGMYERARLINGSFSLESEGGKGTTVSVEVLEDPTSSWT